MQLIVLGMHRTGTSIVTRLINMMGAYFGAEGTSTGANKENPKGFWERKDVRGLNDGLLFSTGSDWYRVLNFECDSVPVGARREFLDKARRLVLGMDAHRPWVAKEPRFCLTLPLWREVLECPLGVVVVRDPSEIALSIHVRNQLSLPMGVALWEAYTRALLRNTRGMPIIVVRHADLFRDPLRTAERLFEALQAQGVRRLSLPSQREIEAFIDPNLYRQRRDEALSRQLLTAYQQNLAAQVESQDWDSIDAPEALSACAYETLDAHLQAYESSRQLDDLAKSEAVAQKNATLLQQTLANKEQESNDLRKEIEKKLKDEAAAGEEAVRLRRELAEIREALAARERAVAELARVRGEKERAEGEVARLRGELESKSKSLAISESAVVELETVKAEKARAEEEMTRLRGELESKSKSLAISESAVTRLRDQLQSTSYLLEQRTTWLRQLDADFSSLLQSKRWKVGNATIRALELAVGRGKVDLAVHHMNEIFIAYRQDISSQPFVNRGTATQSNTAVSSPPQHKGEGLAIAGQRNEPAPSTSALNRILDARSLNATFGRHLRNIVSHHFPPLLSETLLDSERLLSGLSDRLEAITEEDLVSIVMPTYNRADIIGEAIASVIEQDYPHWELLVCDDASTDDTKRVVGTFKESRIRYLQLPKGGAAAARNAGLKEARGTIIAYLDSDNVWHPSFLSAILTALVENPGQCAAYTNYIDFRVNSNEHISIKSFQALPFDNEALLQKNFIDLNTFAHRRELYDCFGGFNEQLTRRQDYDLILKYTWLRDPLNVPCLAVLYQRNENLEQITRTQRHDNSCVSIINESVAQYFSNGLPLPSQPPLRRVTIVSWDLCRNHFSKPFALAEALSAQYEVQLISFRFFEEEIFPPLQGVNAPFETVYLPGGPFPAFFESMARALAAIRGDVIYVVKPRLPSLGLALLANYHRGTPIILEINDLETVVSSPKGGDRHFEAEFESVDLTSTELLNPYCDLWSQIMDPLAKDLPLLVTHNRNIDHHFGNRCLYMRNIKDERVYDPALYDREQIRTDLGFVPEDRVILFGGMLRKHKGIYELVELVERLEDKSYKLLFVGSRPTPDQQRLVRTHGDVVKVLPPQNREAMARINLAADLVVLWLDPNVPASHYQMPYKATDALAMRVPIITNDISDLGELGRQGYLRLVPFGDWDAMIGAVRDLFDDANAANELRDAARGLYLRQFSYAAARSNFALALQRALRVGPGVLPVAQRFAQRFDAFRQVATRKTAPDG